MTEVQRIRLYDKYIAMVKAGEKKATIRRGVKPYVLGPAILVGTESGQEVVVTITDLSIENLGTLLDFDAFEDGFRSVAALSLALKDTYPGLGEHEPLTKVRFEVQT